MATLVETLYYQTYNYYLLDDLYNAKIYLHFLREEFEKDPNCFDVLKEDHRWNHLIGLGNAIDTNKKIEQKIEKINFCKVFKHDEETSYRTQNDLVRAIYFSLDSLKICLQTEFDFFITSVEEETRFGRVDMVGLDKETIYPIELKKNEANHDCIGQISKYILHYKLGLINKMYKFVSGVVISNSFDEFTLKELYNIGVLAVKYKFKSNDRVEFSRV